VRVDALSVQPQASGLVAVADRARVFPVLRRPVGIRQIAVPWLYLVGIIAAEAALRAGEARVALVIDAILLVAALNQAAFQRRHRRAILLGVAVLLVERILSAALPLARLGPLEGFLVVAVPTMVAVGLAIRAAGYTRRDLGLTLSGAAALNSIAGIPLGLAIGIAYYRAVPQPFLVEPSVGATYAPALVVAVALTGAVVEELGFRGLLQSAALRQFGTTFGILFVAALYTVTATSWSPAGTPVVLVVALGLGVITAYLRSLVPAIALHASINIGTLLVGPMLLGSGAGG
jgi:membrane protease YdiL (CAAX protease family)